MELTPKVPPPVETGILPVLINQAQYKTMVEISMRKQIALLQPKTIMLPAPINPAQSETIVTIKQRHTSGNLCSQ
jgi:hypothetical protein